jgi:hypothetical protein
MMIRRLLIGLACVVALNACQRWQPRPPPPIPETQEKTGPQDADQKADRK